MNASTFLGLRCTRCGAEFERGRFFSGCPVCTEGEWAAGLEVVYDFDQAKKRWNRTGDGGLWRYAPLLPLRDDDARVTLGEGATPLVAAPGLLGLRNVWVKNETANPTWSYKDRMCAVGVSVAKELGSTVVAISSTGNQGASGSAYAARARLGSVVLTLEQIEDPTLAFMQAYGALVVRTTRVGRRVLLRHGVESLNWFPISSYTPTPTSNPYALEGYKTIAYEIVEDLGFVPDAVVVPTALGEGLAGIYAGFRDLRQMGLVDSVPRMVAAEPAGGAPLSKTLQQAAPHALTVEPYDSVAVTLATTVASDRALLALHDSAGVGVPVTDEELFGAQAVLRMSGFLAEPAGAAAAAALPHLAAALPAFDPDSSRVVVVLTGTGLRDLAALRQRLPSVPRLQPDIAAFEALWATWVASGSVPAATG